MIIYKLFTFVIIAILLYIVLEICKMIIHKAIYRIEQSLKIKLDKKQIKRIEDGFYIGTYILFIFLYFTNSLYFLH